MPGTGQPYKTKCTRVCNSAMTNIFSKILSSANFQNKTKAIECQIRSKGFRKFQNIDSMLPHDKFLSSMHCFWRASSCRNPLPFRQPARKAQTQRNASHIVVSWGADFCLFIASSNTLPSHSVLLCCMQY